MQRKRYARSHEKKTDGRRRGFSGRVIIIASAGLALIAVAAVILTGIGASDNKAVETAPVPSSPSVESSSAAESSTVGEPSPVAESSPVVRKPLFAADITIDSVRDESVAVALQLIKDLPGPRSIALLGDVHVSNGNSTEAVACWRNSLELDPNNAVALNGIAWVAMKKAEYEEAVALWRRAIEIDPDLPGVHGSLAGALVCLGRSQEAIELLKEEINRSPRPAHSFVMMANQHMLLKEYAEAEAAFKAAIDRQPGYLNAYYGLANVYVRTGEKEKSTEYMNTFKGLKAEQMEASKERDEAFDDLNSVCRKVCATHTAIARRYMTNERHGQAEELLQRAGQLDPEDTGSRRVLAVLYRQAQRQAEALELYEELIRIEPRRMEYYVGKGICAAMLGQAFKAEGAFQEIIRLYPGLAVGYRELALFYLKTGTKPAEALLLTRKAIGIEGSGKNFFLLSWALEANDDQQGAIEAIRSALKLEPNNEEYKKMLQRLSR